MSGLTSFVFNTLSRALFGMDTVTEKATGPHEPSIDDVLDMKDFFLKNSKLPIEIIDLIVDFAEYWPHTTTIRTGEGDFRVRGGDSKLENKLLLRTYPLGYVPAKDDPIKCSMLESEKFPTAEPVPRSSPEPSSEATTEDILNGWTKNSQIRGEFPCRKIVFTIKSHDQGWGGQRGQRGTYKGAFTWFEVGKERLTTLRASMPGLYTAEENLAECATNPETISHESFIGPHFLISADSNSQQNKPAEPIICTSYTLYPAINTRTTAHDPPRIESSFVHPLLPSSEWCLQKNLTATRDTQENMITWTCHDNVNPESLEAKALDDQGRGVATLTGEFVRSMKVGDIVTIWAKARFQGWCNSVEEVKIDVYWAI